MAIQRILVVLATAVYVIVGNVGSLDTTYTIGNLMYRNLSALEDKYVPTTGLYFLPYDVPYSGTLVEIEVCGFVGESFDLERNEIGNFTTIILVYRRVSNGTYSLVDGRISIEFIIEEDENPVSVLRYGCNKILNQRMHRSVNEGDRIAIFIPNPDCIQDRRLTVGSGTNFICFAHPNLASPNCSLALHFPSINGSSLGVGSTVMLEDALHVQEFININVTIAADPLPTQFNTPVISNEEDALKLSWIAIFGVVLGSLVVVLLSMALVVMSCLVVKRNREEHNYSSNDAQLKEPNVQPSFTNAVVHHVNSSEYEDITDSDSQLVEKPPESVTKEPTHDEPVNMALNGVRNRVHSIQNDYSQPYSALFAAVSDEHYEFDSDFNMKQDHVGYRDGSQMMSEEAEDTLDYENEEEFFMPATKEDELKEQLQRLKICVILSNNLELKEELGSGQFGTVHHGVWHHSDSTNDDEEVAVKSMKNEASEEEKVKFLQEATIMGQFNHPNVLNILGIVLDDPLQIVMDIMDKGDLHHHLQSLRPIPGEPVSNKLSPTLLSYSRQIAFGLMYLDIKKFVHRDVAARNVLVASSGVCKIADFGMSRDLQDENYYVAHGGMIPVKWTAPEALMYRKYSSASDVWSYGCLLYEIWSLGYKPFHDVTNAEAMKKVQNGYRLPSPPGCPRTIYHIMIKCWHSDASSRPNPSNVVMGLSHPDFQILNWSSKDIQNSDEEARTLGASIEAGYNLFPDLQKTYTGSD